MLIQTFQAQALVVVVEVVVSRKDFLDVLAESGLNSRKNRVRLTDIASRLIQKMTEY